MPEGDSVYRLARRLRAALDGGVLKVGRLNVPAHAVENLAGLTVLGHRTHGKHLLTDLSDGTSLHTHLKMSGSWTVTRPGRYLPSRLDPDVRVRLSIDGGHTAYGLTLPVVDYGSTPEMNERIAHLGPDPLRGDFDPERAAANTNGNKPKASELEEYARSEGWTKIQTANGPPKYIDENGVTRLTIKSGTDRAPGSDGPHVEIRNADGQRVDPFGNEVTRRSPGNHTPIEWDLP